MIEIGYFGNKGNHLINRIDGNYALPGAGNVNNNRLYTQAYWPGTDIIVKPLGQFYTHHWNGNTNFNSLQTKIEKRFSAGLTVLGSFIWSKTIGDVSGFAATGNTSNSGIQDPTNRKLERSLADEHVGKRFVTSFLYELPVGRGKQFGGLHGASGKLGAGAGKSPGDCLADSRGRPGHDGGLSCEIEVTHRIRWLFLFLDNVTSLPERVSVHLFRMIRILHNERAMHTTPVSFAIAYSFRSLPFFSYLIESSTFAIFHPIIDVGWFNEGEVHTLLSSLDERLVPHCETLFHHYGGQPFLTHIAATRILEDALSPDQVFSEAFAGKDQFRYHVRGVEKVLNEQSDTGLQRVLNVILQGEQVGADIPHRPVEYLLRTHLLNEVDEQLTFPCELYRRLAEQEPRTSGSSE